MPELNLISKEDFVNDVRSSMSLDMIKTAQLAPLDTDERFKLVTLSVMTWAVSQKPVSNLYLYYRDVAKWIKMAHEDKLLSDEEIAQLNMRGIDPLLEFVYQCTDETRGDEQEVHVFLHDKLRTDKTP